jgi:hypothetical protein
MAASKIAHLLLDPAKALTQHASMRSQERDFHWEALKHVASNGNSFPHPEGDHKLITEARDPQNKDVVWKVATDNNPVTRFLTVMKDTSRPFNSNALNQEAAESHKSVARTQNTAKLKALQKQKKQLRSAKANNKGGKNN